MSQRGISIEAIIQKEPPAGASDVPLIMLTNTTREQNLRAAVEEIEALASVNGSIVKIRLESLDA
jgi:homoserine dehydrogenase